MFQVEKSAFFCGVYLQLRSYLPAGGCGEGTLMTLCQRSPGGLSTDIDLQDSADNIQREHDSPGMLLSDVQQLRFAVIVLYSDFEQLFNLFLGGNHVFCV